MNKEQLIKLIELLPIEELNGFKIYYYDKKNYDRYSCNDRKEHNVNYGLDTTEMLVNKIEKLNEQLHIQQKLIEELENK